MAGKPESSSTGTATERTHLTLEKIRKLTAPAVRAAYFFDDDPRQMCVRVTAAGAKSFVYRGKLNGESVRITIGSTTVWNLDDARAEACRLQTMIDAGDDPRQVKAEKVAAAEAKRDNEKRKDVTVGEAWTAYVAARSHKWGDLHRRDHDTAIKAGGEARGRGRRAGQGAVTYPGLIYPLLQMRLSDLTAELVQDWLVASNQRGKTESAKCFRLLRAFINWSAERSEYKGVAIASAHAGREVRDHVQKVRTKKFAVQREQLPAWFDAVRRIQNPTISTYLQGMLITGARRNELAGLLWSGVDFQWNSLTIRDKVEGERTIPLTPYLAHLLRDLQRRNESPPTVRRMNALKEAGKPWKPSEFVFSSATAASGRLANPLSALQTAMRTAGLPNFSIHDLRRSFDTLSEWAEAPAGVVDQITGHKPRGTTEIHYKRRPLDLLRKWHVKIEAWILEQAGVTFQEDAPALQVVQNAAA